MFILRRITPDNVEINTNLGNHYTIILKSGNEELFKRQTKNFREELVKSIFGFITYFPDQKEILPLFTDSKQYIMTETGETFDNLTLKH